MIKMMQMCEDETNTSKKLIVDYIYVNIMQNYISATNYY